MSPLEPLSCVWICSTESGVSCLEERSYPLTNRQGMWLTEAIPLGENMRMRVSEPGYVTEWHVSGQPVLILIQQGTLRIEVENEVRDFKAGDCFVAADTHGRGHRALVIGDERLIACHIKLGFDHE